MDRRAHLGTRVARAVALLVVLGWLGTVLAVVFQGHRDEARPAAAIVVLGAAQYAGRPSPVLRARLDHALDLWRRRLAPLVIVTGGLGTGDTTTEAVVSRNYLRRAGVPDSVIIMETRGRTTFQSLQAVRGIADALPDRTVILVSDPFHMLRLAILSRHLGLVPLTSPTRTSPISANLGPRWKYIFAESVKVPLTLLLEHTWD